MHTEWDDNSMKFVSAVFERFKEFKTWQKILVIVILASLISAPFNSSNKNSSSPTAAPVPAVQNPNKTSDNELGCKSARRVYNENSQVLSDFSQGAATFLDLSVSMKIMGDKFTDIASYTTGDVHDAISDSALEFKKTRIATLSGDENKVLAALTNMLPYANTFNAVCAAIGVN